MSVKNPWLEAIVKLAFLTQDGKLTWSVQDPPPSFAKRPNSRVEMVFESRYGDKNLRLYEGSFKDEPGDVVYELSPFQTAEWRRRVVLEFVDSNGNSLWAFPDVGALDDLLAAVQYRVSGVKEFLSELLAS